ncbi:AQJ64_40280 family protein [Streptomyces sp. NPDC001102]
MGSRVHRRLIDACDVCFVDSDGHVHQPYGFADDDTVTHWAELPTLPGMTTHLVLGDDVQPALQNAWPARPDS